MSGQIVDFMAFLPLERTADDCINWLEYGDVERQAFVADHLARVHARTVDHVAQRAAAGGPSGPFVDPDTGTPAYTRTAHLDMLLRLFILRMGLWAEKHGIDLPDIVAEQLTRDTCEEQLALIEGGLSDPLHFETEQEALAYLASMGANEANKKALAGAANTPKAVTDSKRTTDNGTDCRA